MEAYFGPMALGENEQNLRELLKPPLLPQIDLSGSLDLSDNSTNFSKNQPKNADEEFVSLSEADSAAIKQLLNVPSDTLVPSQFPFEREPDETFSFFEACMVERLSDLPPADYVFQSTFPLEEG